MSSDMQSECTLLTRSTLSCGLAQYQLVVERRYYIPHETVDVIDYPCHNVTWTMLVKGIQTNMSNAFLTRIEQTLYFVQHSQFDALHCDPDAYPSHRTMQHGTTLVTPLVTSQIGSPEYRCSTSVASAYTSSASASTFWRQKTTTVKPLI